MGKMKWSLVIVTLKQHHFLATNIVDKTDLMYDIELLRKTENDRNMELLRKTEDYENQK